MRDNQNLLRKSYFSPSRVTFTVYMYLYSITLKNKQKFYYIEPRCITSQGVFFSFCFHFDTFALFRYFSYLILFFLRFTWIDFVSI